MQYMATECKYKAFNSQYIHQEGSRELNLQPSYVISANLECASVFAAFFARNLSENNRGLLFRIPYKHRKSQRPVILRGFSNAYTSLDDRSTHTGADLLRAQRKRSIVVDDSDTIEWMRVNADGFDNLLKTATIVARRVVDLPPTNDLQIRAFHILIQDGVSADGLSTTFGVHQDSEEDVNGNEPRLVTVVVRLSNQGITEMNVEGAPAVFLYGSRIGDAAAFLSQSFHRSIPCTEQQTKIAFFFYKHCLTARDTRAKRKKL